MTGMAKRARNKADYRINIADLEPALDMVRPA